MRMDEISRADALLEQVDDLIDDPRNASIPGDAELQPTVVESRDRIPPSRVGSFPQLAPAAIGTGGGAPSSSPRAKRLAPPPVSPPQPLREQDRLLPMDIVAHLMALELPNNAKISHDAKELMQEMVTEIICFVASEENDVALAEVSAPPSKFPKTAFSTAAAHIS